MLPALGPGVFAAYRGLQPGLLLYTHDYLRTFRSPFEQEYSHGVLDALKALYEKQIWFRFHTGPLTFTGMVTPPTFLALYGTVALLLAALMIFRLRRLPMLNQVLGVCIALTLLPPSAADYTLCSLYLPALLSGYFLCTEVRSCRACWTWPHMLLLLLPLAALLSPLNVFGFWTSPSRLLLLLILCGGTLFLPLRLMELDGAIRVAADA